MPEDILENAAKPADMRLSYGSDKYQFADLRVPKGNGPFPIVISIHGGYWRAKYDLEYMGHMCDALAAKGIATWNLEYRRVGNPGGGWPGTFEDVRNGYHYIVQNAKKYNLDERTIIVTGHSAGGHLALCLASYEPTVKNVIAFAGVVDLQRAWEEHLSDDAVVELLGGTPSAVPEHYEEADTMRRSIESAAQFLVHGTGDDIVPVSFSSTYAEKKIKSGEKVTFISLPAADHFDVVDPNSKTWPDIEQRIVNIASNVT